MTRAARAALAVAAGLLVLPTRAADALVPVDETAFRKVIGSHRGKIVVADFWATWCEPCREEMPGLAALARKWRRRGVVLVTVSADEPEQEQAALEFLGKTGVPPPAYVKRASSDEDFINSVDRAWSGALPALFIYDRQGRQAGRFTGETELSQVEDAIRKLL